MQDLKTEFHVEFLLTPYVKKDNTVIHTNLFSKHFIILQTFVRQTDTEEIQGVVTLPLQMSLTEFFVEFTLAPYIKTDNTVIHQFM